ncbi:MAG: glycosyltransferase family 2 protein [Prevotella sp.]|nr:glycosyltransferase family 2 protein [Prevotella sp.]
MEDKHGRRISVVINTYNASAHLQRVIESVKDFDEILVCDMESTDDTVDIARRSGCRVVTFAKNGCDIVEPARQFAIDSASYDHVLVVDADELVPAALRKYLYAALAADSCPDGIAVPRRNYFMGRFMHSAYPDYVLRFFDRRVTVWPPVIHTSPQVDGTVERIPAARRDLAFEHLANDSVGTIIRKADTYSTHELPRRRHKNYGCCAIIYRPAFRFFKSYVLKKGFLDGMPGLIHACLDAIYQFVIVAKLTEEKGKENSK